MEGWHRLRIAQTLALRLWLDGEAGYCELAGVTSDLRDMVMPAADFTGRRLHTAPVLGAARSLEAKVFMIEPFPATGHWLTTAT